MKTLQTKWQADVPDIDNKDWDYPFSQLVASRDSAGCARKNMQISNVFWTCTEIKNFVAEVTQFIVTLTTVRVPLTIEVCLLGLMTPLAPVGHLESSLVYSFFTPAKPL